MTCYIGCRAFAIALIVGSANIACSDRSGGDASGSDLAPSAFEEPVAWLSQDAMLIFHRSDQRLDHDAVRVNCEQTGLYRLQESGRRAVATGQRMCTVGNGAALDVDHQGRFILVVSNQQVDVVDLEGDRVVDISIDHLGVPIYGSWQPTGTSFALASTTRGNERREGHLYVVHADELPNSSLIYSVNMRRINGPPSWDPRGERLVIAVHSEGNTPLTGDVFVVDTTGSARRIASGFGPSWSPDGESIAYYKTIGTQDAMIHDSSTSATETRAIAIRVITPSGALDREVYSSTDLVGRLVWSPDGRFLAFARASHDGAEVWVVDVESEEVAPAARVLHAGQRGRN